MRNDGIKFNEYLQVDNINKEEEKRYLKLNETSS